MTLPRRRRVKPIHSTVSMKLDGCKAHAASTAAAEIAVLAVSDKVQSSARRRDTESAALTRIHYGIVRLSPEQELALALEIEGKRTVYNKQGLVKRRPYSGIALLDWVAKRMRERGYSEATPESVRRLLAMCDTMLSLGA